MKHYFFKCFYFTKNPSLTLLRKPPLIWSYLLPPLQIAVIGFFSDVESDSAKAFLEVASTNDDLKFGITSDSAVNGEYDISGDTVVLFKKFDEGRNDLTEDLTDSDKVAKFVAANSLPLIVDFNHETAQKIFSGDIKTHLLLFLSYKADEYKGQVRSYELRANFYPLFHALMPLVKAD